MRLKYLMISVFGLSGLGNPAASQATQFQPTPSYEYPIGTNLFDVYQNVATGTISILSSDRTFNQEISRSDVFYLSRSLADLDLDGADGTESYVRYTGYWRDVAQEVVNPSNINAPGFSVDRDGSIRIIESATRVFYACFGDCQDVPAPRYTAPIEVCLSNCNAESSSDRVSYFYGRQTLVEPITKTLKSQTLIAYTQEAYDYAISQGYDAVFDTVYTDQNVQKVGSFAAPEGWAITADEVRGSTGNRLITSSADTVSVANGSLRVTPGSSPSTPGTTIASSDGRLILGDSSSHRTIVRGTLEVQDPTAPDHAANKRYVDGATSLAMAISSLPVSPDGGPYLGIAAGTLGSETAFALGFSHTEPTTGFQLKFNIGHSASSGTGAAVGIGIGF
jgi:hypothetical protein